MTTMQPTARLARWLDDPSPVAAEPEKLLPFRAIFGVRGNIAILLVAFILVLGFACTIGALTITLKAGDPRMVEFLKLLGICAVVLGQIALLLSNALNAAGIKRTRHDLKDEQFATRAAVEVFRKETMATAREVKATAEGAAKRVEELHPAVVAEVADQVRKSEQNLYDLPKTREEWRDFFRDELRATAKEICDEVMKGR